MMTHTCPWRPWCSDPDCHPEHHKHDNPPRVPQGENPSFQKHVYKSAERLRENSSALQAEHNPILTPYPESEIPTIHYSLRENSGPYRNREDKHTRCATGTPELLKG